MIFPNFGSSSIMRLRFSGESSNTSTSPFATNGPTIEALPDRYETSPISSLGVALKINCRSPLESRRSPLRPTGSRGSWDLVSPPRRASRRLCMISTGRISLRCGVVHHRASTCKWGTALVFPAHLTCALRGKVNWQVACPLFVSLNLTVDGLQDLVTWQSKHPKRDRMSMSSLQSGGMKLLQGANHVLCPIGWEDRKDDQIISGVEERET